MEKPCSWITTSPESAIFFVHPKHPQEMNWTSGQPCLSLLRLISTHHQARTTLLQPLSRATAYVESTSRSMRIGNWNKSWPMQVPFPELADLWLFSDDVLGIPFWDCQNHFFCYSPCPA